MKTNKKTLRAKIILICAAALLIFLIVLVIVQNIQINALENELQQIQNQALIEL